MEEKQLLVRVRNYTEDCIFAYYMLDKYYSKNGKRFYSDIDCDYPIDIKDVIAWKEIELPELKEDEIESEMFPEIILPEGSSEFIDKVIADAEKRVKEI